MKTTPLVDDWTRGPGPAAVFAEFLARDEFRIRRCCACGSHLFYPRLALCHGNGGVLSSQIANILGTEVAL